MLLAYSFSMALRSALLAAAVWRLSLCWTLCWLAATPASGEVPRGSAIEISLLTPLSSYHSRAGAPVSAYVSTPMRIGGQVLIPSGTTVRGTLVSSQRVGIGLWRERAKLVLRFDRLELPDGKVVPLNAKLTQVDNAREAVDRHGCIRGIRATDAYSHRVGFRMARLALGSPLTAGPAALLYSLLFRFPEPEISYGPGTDMLLQTTESLSLEGDYSGTEVLRELPAERFEEIRSRIATMPYWSRDGGKGDPVDIVNLVYAGSREELERAFEAARWSGAHTMSPRSGFRAVRAVMDGREYSDGPMRTLFIDNEAPGMTFQKSLNTFSKRHHLRIWRRPGDSWDGRHVWACAATQDIGTTVSLRPFGFTHRVDGEIDQEREKVVNDLVRTGCVDSVSYVPRAEHLRYTGGTDRKHLKTDGAVAFVVLNACREPRVAADAEPASEHPGLGFRLARRVLLTARNYALRDNWYWRAGEAAQFGTRATLRWYRSRRPVAAQPGSSRSTVTALNPAMLRDGFRAN